MKPVSRQRNRRNRKLARKRRMSPLQVQQRKRRMRRTRRRVARAVSLWSRLAREIDFAHRRPIGMIVLGTRTASFPEYSVRRLR
jgi:hypothetical protein